MKVMPNTAPSKWLWFASLTLIAIVLGAVALTWKLGGWNEIHVFERYRGEGAFAPFSARQAPPVEDVPRLEVDERAYIKEYMEGQGKLLYHYAWVDRSKGVVRIPIYRAMERLLEKGLPTRGNRP